jgi:bacillolysin
MPRPEAYTPSSPIWARSIKPAETIANTPLNGQQVIKTSRILFENGKTRYGLVTERSIREGGDQLDENIQTLDFRNIAIPAKVTVAQFYDNYIKAPTFLSKNNKWTNRDFGNSEIARGALDAHFGASQALSYYFEEFGRNSVDDKGMVLLNAIAPVMINAQGQLEDGHNANWNGSFEYDGINYGMMRYYDGVARTPEGAEAFGDIGLVAGIDVLGHEVTHGVTEFTADLKYEGESGALNEGFSDIFGTNVKADVQGRNIDNKPNWTWVLGEDWWPIRNMENPNQYQQPDTYGGEHWIADPLTGYSAENDQGGVHTNSGVLNYWYVLAVEGSGNVAPGRENPDLLVGSHEDYTNDNGYVYRVEGIGLDKMQGVAYRALDKYLKADSKFINARKATIRAARDLTREGVADRYPGVPLLSDADVSSVIAAWDAVGVGGGFGPVDAAQLI